MKIEEAVLKVESKNDFLNFMEQFINDYKNNYQEWENTKLEDFLDALKDWIEGMESFYEFQGRPIPKNVNWNLFANALYAAKIYE